MSRLAIIDYNKCQPKKCNFECGLYCPVNMQGKECVSIQDIEDIGKKAKVSSAMCIGCGICIKKCPFNAVNIVNVPKQLKNDFLIYSYGTNSFRVYNKPSVKKGSCIGILGANGLGKSTILKILSGETRLDLKEKVLKKLISGSELFKYLSDIETDKLSVSYKPQDVLVYSKSSMPVRKILNQINDFYIKDFKLKNIENRKLKDLSGGEMQRLMIAKVCSMKKKSYLFDEPSAFLDIKQRMKVANCIINKVNQENYILCIEHDLCVLDYICDYITCLYGESNCYGVITSLYSTFHGINSYLDGYFRKENIKFRDKPIKFNFDISKKEIYEDDQNYNYTNCEINHSNQFKLQIEGGNFKKGELILLIGENGTGKSSFINMICGKYKYINQNFGGLIVSQKDQNPYLNFDGSVRELLEIHINKSLSDSSFISNVLKPLNIINLYDNKVVNLSGGQMQKLSISICLGQKADIFLLDEPSAYIDVDDRLKIANIIKHYTTFYNKIVFLVEHDIIMATSISDKVIVFEGEPSKNCVAKSPEILSKGINSFLANINITMRRDEISNRPRINKLNSNKDQEQKKTGNYFL